MPPAIFPSVGVPICTVLPNTLDIFAPVVQLSTPDPLVVNTCPVVPPVIVIPVFAPRFTLLPLKLRLPSAEIAFPAIDMFAQVIMVYYQVRELH